MIKKTGVMQNQSVTSLQNETKFSFDARQNEKRGVLMKRKRLMIVIGFFVILGIAVLIVSGRKPYKNLEASDIVSATVHLIPPDKTIQITDISFPSPFSVYQCVSDKGSYSCCDLVYQTLDIDSATCRNLLWRFCPPPA